MPARASWEIDKAMTIVVDRIMRVGHNKDARWAEGTNMKTRLVFMMVRMRKPKPMVTDTSAWGFVTRKQAEAKLLELRGHRPVDKWFQRQIDDENRLYEQFARVLERYIDRMWGPLNKPREMLFLAEMRGRRVFEGRE